MMQTLGLNGRRFSEIDIRATLGLTDKNLCTFCWQHQAVGSTCSQFWKDYCSGKTNTVIITVSLQKNYT